MLISCIAAKLARREGVRFVLDPLAGDPAEGLNEHIDGLTSGFPRPRPRSSELILQLRGSAAAS